MAKLYFRYGAVGSAKTLNLIAVAHNYTSQGKAVVIAKPNVDVRFGVTEVASRAGLSKEATLILHDDIELRPEFFKNIHCLLVDEAQFLSAHHIDMFRVIADAGCPVICYGLRTDFRTHVFSGSLRLLELADTIEEVKTTCYYCNKKATFNVKLVNGHGTLSGAQVELGCEEKYLPVCSGHYKSLTADCRTTEGKEDVVDDPVSLSKLAMGSEVEPPASVDVAKKLSADAVNEFKKMVEEHNKDKQYMFAQ